MEFLKYFLICIVGGFFSPRIASAYEFTMTQSFAKYSDSHMSDQSDPDIFKFQQQLIQTGQFYVLDTKNSHGALLVVERNYLEPLELERIAGDIAEALDEVPKFIGRPFVTNKRITLYIYDSGPMSQAAHFGVEFSWGILLRFVKEDLAPTFHEVTHLTQTDWQTEGSQSLDEGFADFVQEHFRPGKAHDFHPANANPDLLAKSALQTYGQQDFLNSIGVPGWTEFKIKDERFSFYFTSWSFVKYLVNQYGISTFLEVQDAAGSPMVYSSALGNTFENIRNAWVLSL